MLTQGSPLHTYCICLSLCEIKYSYLFLTMPIHFYGYYFLDWIVILSVKYASLLICGIIKMYIIYLYSVSKPNRITQYQ